MNNQITVCRECIHCHELGSECGSSYSCTASKNSPVLDPVTGGNRTPQYKDCSEVNEGNCPLFVKANIPEDLSCWTCNSGDKYWRAACGMEDVKVDTNSTDKKQRKNKQLKRIIWLESILIIILSGILALIYF